ncbi:hypothetical protein AAZX31_19G046500 [Glycine max]|uniref:Uncharacterized protein n=2 Tax=Glycine subgen. Soja TaxID=1462606 RepID=I1N6V6_SOYBN|nr:pentatricopeptide repeat-containing protein At4g35850, mitochondrial [Glycine max]XP_028215808.1 pentatricopeptide repeat-containing protein At4g35850, mitochondrial-like [Glycine soja]KAH1076485.1 hypothetical protein GYH30_052116 [Glycine max]KRG93954.1 hypothetical protein GLYMA_19G052100v4 [Glycine max]|eukprot:XP_003553289.1 pentatricopeptide repeat-containing protein At4g35850, mitochondrial [Glycine max]
MKFLQSLIAQSRYAARAGSLNRVSGLRFFSVSTEEYSKRNYANNVAEYNTVLGSLTAQRRNFLLRDVYDDMMLDGVKPTRDTFHSLAVGTMKAARMQDAFYFADQMKIMGLLPDVTLYNFLISTCGKCKNSNKAIQILEEMKCMEVKPNIQTYICLLNACAADGRIDRVYAIVRDMTAAGLGLNEFCYAGLIVAHKNKTPLPDDFAAKVIEFVERSKMWSSVETNSANAENVMMGVSDEELYSLPTAEYAHRRGGFVVRQFTAYHTAFHAAADLKNVELTDTLLEMLNKQGKTPDIFILMQVIRCYCHAGDIERGLQNFENHLRQDRSVPAELFVTLAEGAMVGYTEKGMQMAQDILVRMNERNIFLNNKLGSELLFTAAGEKTGGYITANYIWDLMQARGITPSFPAVEAYYQGLKDREIPEDDPRLVLVSRIHKNLSVRFGNRTNINL